MSRMILVVEDDDDIRAALVDLLQAEGFVTAQAADGYDGLRMLREGLRPVLILLDLQMPRLTGWQFITASKQDARIADLPILVMSGSDLDHLPVPANDFLPKPLRRDSLLAAVDRKCSPR